MTHCDFVGQELKIGDEVAYFSYGALYKGVVCRFTPKMVYVNKHDRVSCDKVIKLASSSVRTYDEIKEVTERLEKVVQKVIDLEKEEI